MSDSAAAADVQTVRIDGAIAAPLHAWQSHARGCCPPMRQRWLSHWVNHPSVWIDVILFAVIGALVVVVSISVFG